MVLLKSFANPFRHQPVAAVFFVRCIEGGPVGFDILPRSAARQTDRAFRRIKCSWERVFGLSGREILVPRLCINEVVQQFSLAAGVVSVIAKMLRQEFCIRQNFAHLLAVFVQAGTVRRTACHNGCARRITGSTRAVSVCEQHAAGGQSIKVRCDGLSIPTETTNPVVKVVNGDKQDVGPPSGLVISHDRMCPGTNDGYANHDAKNDESQSSCRT